jgi:hypothetical protein
MKASWENRLDRITNNVVENPEPYKLGAIIYCAMGTLGFVLNMHRHRAGLGNYWLSSSMLLLAIVYGYFLARARAVRKLRDAETK